MTIVEMDNIPFLREMTSIFSVPGGPQTNAGMKSTANSLLRWGYIIFALAIVFGGAYYMFNVLQRPIAGILYFIGATIAVYFYYVKWFIIPAKRPDWPPYTTLCPDYLTPVLPDYAKDRDGNTIVDPNAKVKCVDFVGVSENGLLKTANPGNLQAQLLQPNYFFEVDPKMKRDELKARLDVYGLSWESLFKNASPQS